MTSELPPRPDKAVQLGRVHDSEPHFLEGQLVEALANIATIDPQRFGWLVRSAADLAAVRIEIEVLEHLDDGQ